MVGVPCEGAQQAQDRESPDGMVSIASVDGRVAVTTRTGERKIREEMLFRACPQCRYPNALYAGDVAALCEPDQDRTRPDFGELDEYESLSDDQKQALLEEPTPPVYVASPASMYARCACVGISASTVAAAGIGGPESGCQGELAVSDDPYDACGGALPVAEPATELVP